MSDVFAYLVYGCNYMVHAFIIKVYMRKILTRLATLVLIVVVMISFSACSLFTVNLDKKYSSSIMVATAENDDISISRQELYYAYMEWGYQYAQQIETKELLEQINEENKEEIEKKNYGYRKVQGHHC